MVIVDVRVANLKAPIAIAGKERRRMMARMLRVGKRLVEDWRKLVISSTWFDKRPAPTDSIVATWVRGGKRGKDIEGWVLTYGWIAYRGSPARALHRLGLREKLYTDKAIERIRRALAGRLKAGG
jgi:hypothetical protein